MTAFLLLTFLIIAAGVAGSLGLIRDEHDAGLPHDPFVRHS